MTRKPAKKIEKPPSHIGLKLNLGSGLIFGIFIGRDLGISHQICGGYGSGYASMTGRHVAAVAGLTLTWIALVALTLWYIKLRRSWRGLIYLAIILLSLAYYISSALGVIGNNLCIPPF